MKFNSDIVIGLEIHVELNTKTKLFCSCATSGNDEPNSRVCPICLGHPGSRPVLNKKALDYAIKLGLALGCKFSKELVFSRKSYFYPDMSKNFQTTQFEDPIGKMGKLKLKSGKTINITRIHIEEDPASITYPGTMNNSSYSYIDYNRSGNPLIEIVTEPDITTPQEARDFLNQLINLLSYLEIFDLNEGIIKADANISIRESDYTRVEVKNISGFKDIEKALEYEIKRHKKVISKGQKIVMQTRGWDAQNQITFLMRTKETEADYGYIIEPDLSIIDITNDMLKESKKSLVELPENKFEKYINVYKIDPIDARVIVSDKQIADLYEEIIEKNIDKQLAAKWMKSGVLRVLNYTKKTLKESPFDKGEIIELLNLIESKTISEVVAQKIMENLSEKKFSPKEYVKENNLSQINNDDEIERHVVEVINNNQKAVKDYKDGGQKSFNFLFGQIMRQSKGKASPDTVKKILELKLK